MTIGNHVKNRNFQEKRMCIRSGHLMVLGKCLLAAAVLLALIAFPARELMPSLSLGAVLWRV